MLPHDSNAQHIAPQPEAPLIERGAAHPRASNDPVVEKRGAHSQAAEARSRTGRQLRIFAALVALALAGGFMAVHHLKSNAQDTLAAATLKAAAAAPVVDVVTAQPSPASLPLKLPGETAAWYSSVIYARVDGYVATWVSDIGDHVTKGQVLATIETPDLDAQLAAAQAKLKTSQALVVARQADADFAKTTYQRWKNSPKGVVSEQERDAKKAGYNSAVARLNEAQAQVGLDQADVDQYTSLEAFKQVTAPYDGIITRRHIDVGDLVTAGSTSNTTSLYSIVQDDPIRVFVDVPQSAAAYMNTDMQAKITTNTIPGRVFDGKVTRTADAIDQRTRTLHVEVDIPNPDHALVSGLYVDVAFQIPTQGQGGPALVRIPAAAIVFRSNGPHVAVVGKDGKVHFHKVAIARDGGDIVEIGSGLAVGDRVVLNISSQITDGETVDAHELTDGSNADAKK